MLAETTIGLYKNECVRADSPFRRGRLNTLGDVEYITADYVAWYNLSADSLARNEVVTAQLDQVTVASAGEVRRRDGTWVAAPPIPGAFVCNIGDCLMRWSNDIYLSTPHRVTNPASRDRYSVAFFLDPNPDVIVECLPGCCTDAVQAKYPPIIAADYLKSRFAATYA